MRYLAALALLLMLVGATVSSSDEGDGDDGIVEQGDVS